MLGVVALGGAAGTLLRALLAEAFPPGRNGFPWDTLAVNLAGSAVLGAVIVLAVERGVPSAYFRPLLGTGFCGGLTTFSAFAVEVDLQIRAGRVGTAVVYAAASLAGGLAAARAAMLLARAVWIKEVA